MYKICYEFLCIPYHKSCSIACCTNNLLTLLIPVKLDSPWYEDPRLQVLQIVTNALVRSKCVVAELILGVTALIAILGSFAASTTTLVQDMHTAHHVDLSKNVSLALATQELIDRKLDAKVNALEEAVLHIGNELMTLKVRNSFRCHHTYSWICVTPLEVNSSIHRWEQIQRHITGMWNHSNLSLELSTLHRQIHNLSQSPDLLDPTVVASSFLNSLQTYIGQQKLLYS